MTGHQMKSGGSGLFENLANKTLEQYLANNIHNGSPSMVRESHSNSKCFPSETIELHSNYKYLFLS